VPGEQVLVAGEEHPVDRAAGLLQSGPGLRAGDDHDVPGRTADDELAGHRSLQVVPERIGQEHTRLQAIEGEHERRRLAVQAYPGEALGQRHGGLPPDGAVGQPETIKIGPGDQAVSEGRAERVPDGQVAQEVVQQQLVDVRVVLDRYEHGQERGAGNAHITKPTRDLPARHRPSSGEWIEGGRYLSISGISQRS